MTHHPCYLTRWFYFFVGVFVIVKYINSDDPNFADKVEIWLEEDENELPDDNSSCDEDNEEVMIENPDEIDVDLMNEDEEELTSAVNTIKGKNGHIWSLIPPKRTRTQARNIIKIPRPKNISNILSEIHALNLLIDSSILEVIVKYTNKEIESRAANYTAQRFVYKTDEIEIKGLLGILFYSGVRKDGHLSTEEMWSGSSIYKLVMSEMRFKFLILCLRFDDKQTRDRSDKFSPIRALWSVFIQNCRKQYTPHMYLTIDEQLLGFRGKCPFRVYIASKPDKYGIKIVTLCDAKTFYMIDAIPYVGKENRFTEDSLPTYYVKSLSETVRGTNRNITWDN